MAHVACNLPLYARLAKKNFIQISQNRAKKSVLASSIVPFESIRGHTRAGDLLDDSFAHYKHYYTLQQVRGKMHI
jgi:hypothetical protein